MVPSTKGEGTNDYLWWLLTLQNTHCPPDSSDVGCHTSTSFIFLSPWLNPVILHPTSSKPLPAQKLPFPGSHSSYNRASSAMLSFGPLSWSSPCLSLSLSTHASTHGQVRSAGHIQSTSFTLYFELFQMSLVVLSLISTIKYFTLNLPWRGHILRF